ncbi:dystrotelin [Stigmatopora argus]
MTNETRIPFIIQQLQHKAKKAAEPPIMDASLILGLEDFNKIRPPAYRVAMKLESLQSIYRMDIVLVHHIEAALELGRRAKKQQDSVLSEDQVTGRLDKMFRIACPEWPDNFTLETSEKLSSLIFRMFDRDQLGQIRVVSLYIALTCLSSENLLLKYGALVCAVASSSGSITRASLRSLLEDVSQVPAVIQETEVFGDVEDAVKSCFRGVLTSTVSREHVTSWLQSEPRPLLWLRVMHRLVVSQKVVHAVRCHICKTFPINGLRYRCVKCLKVHVCQSCFLSEQRTRKHKSHHPVIEFCTPPTWRESFSSFFQSARHSLLPRRHTQKGESRKGLSREEAKDSQSSARLKTNRKGGSTNPTECVSYDSSMQLKPSSSKSLQTDETLVEQLKVSTLVAEVRDLQREKRQLEDQLEVWRLTLQSEQGKLNERCAEMEVTMETVREHNLTLQATLTQTLNKLEFRQRANEKTQHLNEIENEENTKKENVTPISDVETCTDENLKIEEELVSMTDAEWSESEQTPPPTIDQDVDWSQDICYDIVDCAAKGLPAMQQEEVDICMADEQNHGTNSPQELLQQTMEQLLSVLATHIRKDTQTGGNEELPLIDAAEQIGDSLLYLVDAVRQVPRESGIYATV